jgi:hypothetical protein
LGIGLGGLAKEEKLKGRSAGRPFFLFAELAGYLLTK